MKITRQQTTTRLPIPRKGTTYIARASSHWRSSVPVVIAIRDMLKMAQTAKEVKEMIKQKLLKVNGRIVEDYRESIRLFNILEAGKSYVLTILPTKKFKFEETKNKDIRLCKVINKKLLGKNTIQLNLHDGSNVISKDKIKVGDSLYLDFAGKIKKHIALEKGKEAFVMSGSYTGFEGKLEGVDGSAISIKFMGKEEPVSLDQSQVIVQ